MHALYAAAADGQNQSRRHRWLDDRWRGTPQGEAPVKGLANSDPDQGGAAAPLVALQAIDGIGPDPVTALGDTVVVP
jgi:hypothetical protein